MKQDGETKLKNKLNVQRVKISGGAVPWDFDGTRSLSNLFTIAEEANVGDRRYSGAASTLFEPDIVQGEDFAFVGFGFKGLSRKNPFRAWCIRVSQHQYLQRLVVLMVILNTLLLAFYTPVDRTKNPSASAQISSRQNDMLDRVEIGFNLFFTLETCIKIIAIGFFKGSESYLQSGWNRLDFVILSTSWLSVFFALPIMQQLALHVQGYENIPQNASKLKHITYLRSFRVFKVLRTIYRIAGIRTLVTSLFDALGLLMHVMGLLFVLFFVFSVVGLQIFKGSFHQVCFPFEVSDINLENAPRCSLTPSIGRQCPANSKCMIRNPVTGMFNPNPNFGVTSFDNIFSSFLTVFQCVSTEGWVDVMYWTFETKSWLSSIYFVILIFVGALFFVNLIVAVIHEAYDRKYREVQRNVIKSKICMSTIQKDSTSKVGNAELNYSKMHMLSEMEIEVLLHRFRANNGEINYLNFLSYSIPGPDIRKARKELRSYLKRSARRSVDSRIIFKALDANGDGQVDEKELEAGIQKLLLPINKNTVRAVFQYLDSDGSGGISLHEFFDFAAPPSEERQALEDKLKLGFLSYVQRGLCAEFPFLRYDTKGTGQVSKSNFRAALQEVGYTNVSKTSSSALLLPGNATVAQKLIYRFRVRAHTIVLCPSFKGLMNFMIVTNVILLSTAYEGMSKNMEIFLDRSNRAFTAFFGVEMVLKVAGFGWGTYTSDKYNIFDMSIVLMGFFEICFDGIISVNVTILTAFRLFRIFRVLKLARNWKNLKILLDTIMQSWQGLANFSLLLTILIYVGALFGMEMYGGKFNRSYGFLAKPRANFDSIFGSILSVFQVLSGENWNEIMYDCIRVNGIVGAVYAVTIFFVGNYVMLNLFLAILLQNFESAGNNSNKSYCEPPNTNKTNPFSIVVRAIRFVYAGFTGQKVLKRSTLIGNKKRSLKVGCIESKCRDFKRSGKLAKSVVLPAIDEKENSLENSLELHYHDIADQLHLNVPTMEIRKSFRTFHACIKSEKLIKYILNDPTFGVKYEEQALQLCRKLLLLKRIEVLSSPNQVLLHGSTDKYNPNYLYAENSVVRIVLREQRRSVPETMRLAQQSLAIQKIQTAESRARLKRELLKGYSLGCFAPENRLRIKITHVLLHPHFEWAVLMLIGISCVVAAIESPNLRHSNAELYNFIMNIDALLTAFFTIELTMKIIAHGFCRSPMAYMKDSWNILDFTIVAFSIVHLAFGSAGGHSLRFMRAARALRPLRVVNKNVGIKLVVHALLKALPSIINASIIVLLFFLVFGILGVDMFRGKFYFCHGSAQDKWNLNQTACVGNYIVENVAYAREWRNPSYHFDNIGNALLVLFELSTLEMWPTVMHAAMDITSPENAPIPNASQYNAVYFVAFVIVCGFFIMSLFLGIVIFKFDEIKQQENGSLFLTDEQRKWVAMQRKILASKPHYVPEPPDNRHWPLQNRAFRLITHKYFKQGVMACVTCNVLLMSLQHFNETAEFASIINQIQQFFSALFAIEVLITLFGLGRDQYFHSLGNRFDFAIVFLSMFSVLLELNGSEQSFDINILRAFRVARLFILLRHSSGMLSILRTLVASLPSLCNVGSLLFLLYFVFAILGMNVFGQEEKDFVQGDCINDVVNFQDIGLSILTLFRSSTGESWNCIMHDLMKNHPVVAPVYFVLFTTFGSFIVLNLLIAVILENFNDYTENSGLTIEQDLKKKRKQSTLKKPKHEFHDEDAATVINGRHIDAFQAVWGKFSKRGNLFLPSYYLLAILRTLESPLGFKKTRMYCARNTAATSNSEVSESYLLQHIQKLQVKEDQHGHIFYLDVFHSLCREAMPDAYRIFDSDRVEKEFEIRMGTIVLNQFIHVSEFQTNSFTTVDLTHECNAATALQSLWRAHRLRQTMYRYCITAKSNIPTIEERNDLDHIQLDMV